MIEDGEDCDGEAADNAHGTGPEGEAGPVVVPTPDHDLPAAALLDPPEAPAEPPSRDPAPEETPWAPEPPHPADPPSPETPPEEPSPLELPPVEEPLAPPAPPEVPPAPPAAPPPAPESPPLTMAPPIPAKVPRRRFGVGRALHLAMVSLLLFVLIGPPLGVIAYKFVPPPFTWLMVERLVQGQGLTKQWVALGDIDPSLPNAVIAGEDANFCEHHGFDFEAMQAAMRANARHPGKVRGGSTISQQVAKNVFLWPSRDYVRKGLEAYFTVLIEAIWGKRRIMEMYLNEVEWGPGTYGAQAAARRYFGEDASDIDPGEASRLAAILPSPLKWKAVNPGRYVQKRSRRIGAAAGTVREDGLAGCLKQ